MDYKNWSAFDGCRCDHYLPEMRTLVTPTFNRDLAAYWRTQSTSARVIYETVLEEFYVHHLGALYGISRARLDLSEFDEGGDDLVDRAFGGGYRNLRRYLERAEKNRVNRLSKEHLNLAVLLQHARSIRNCRTLGFCRKQPCKVG